MTLRLENLCLSFKGNSVFQDVSLEVEKGETLVLFGPSGSGKTVLLRLIAGFIEPAAGRILINNNDMADVEPEHRNVGMAFQNFALFPHMDATENISAALSARKLDKKSIAAKVKDLAELLKIHHVLDHKPKALSNGQKQRTALARALAGEPEILLLDDPLRNVDAKLRFEMRLELPRLLSRQQATVIYVTQDYKEAMALGDKIAVLSGQGIQQLASPEMIYNQPETIEIARLFGDPAINLFDVIPEIEDAKAVVTISEHKIPIGIIDKSIIGKESILAIRPEALSFAPRKGKNCVEVDVEAETPLNEKTVILTRMQDGQEVMISRPVGTKGPKVGGKAYIKFAPESCHLFDRHSQKRLSLS